MPTTYHNDVCGRTEDAVVAYLVAQALANIPAGQIYPGLENSTAIEDESAEALRALPCVTVICQNAQPDGMFDAGDGTNITWRVQCDIRVRSNAQDTTRAAHRTRTGEVFSVFNVTTIAADLSSALADFTCLKVIPGGQSYSIIGRSWESVMTVQLVATGYDVS